jgi:hypothetical protein
MSEVPLYKDGPASGPGPPSALPLGSGEIGEGRCEYLGAKGT